MLLTIVITLTPARVLLFALFECIPAVFRGWWTGPWIGAPEKIMDGAVGLPMDCNVALGYRPTVSLLPGSIGYAAKGGRACMDAGVT